MFYPPQLSLSCNVMSVILVPDVFLFQTLFNECCTYTFLQWWLQIGEKCEVVFIFIVYWMMLPETLTKQHEMERQLTNGIGYGRKWSWVNLRYYINWGNPCKTHQDIHILGQDLNSGFPKYEAGMLRMWSWLFMTKFNAKIIGFNAVWEGRQK